MLPMLRNPFAPPLMSIDPWTELRREVDGVFDSVLSGRPTRSGGRTLPWIPAMDVEETDDVVRLTLEVPGVDPGNVDITVDDGVLTVSGERRHERKEGDVEHGAGLVERRYGRFERSVTLPEYADAERIEARCEHGVLTIEMPRTAQSRRRRIEIGRGAERQQQQLGSGQAADTRGTTTERARERRKDGQVA